MRTIRFRGKAIEECQWVYGFFQSYDKRAYIKSDEASGRFGCGIEVEPNTVGQFTGLYDCKGREIYEGDIIRRKAKMTFLGNAAASTHEVKFGEDGIYSGFYLDPSCDVFFNSHNRFVFEVIGNIHDNPE